MFCSHSSLWQTMLSIAFFPLSVLPRDTFEARPPKVTNDLGPDAIMLCFEKFNEKCHRRLVASWLETSLWIVIPEFGHRREESCPMSLQAKRIPPKERT
jgi:hypothetical protein